MKDYLKKVRTDAGMSQGKLARALGYTTNQYVSNWERGVSNPPGLETLKLICEITETSKDEMAEQYLDYVETLVEEAGLYDDSNEV